MIKLNKGISLVSLVITIAVMLIITSITVSVSYNRFEINNLNKLKNDLELLEDKVSNYYLRYNVIPVVRDENNTIRKYTYTTLNFNKNTGDNENYYIIDLEAMDGISLNYGKEGFDNENYNKSDDVYIINEKSHQIYYVRGIELDGEFYHSILDNNTDISIANDKIPPTKPEIKMVSGETNEQGVYTSAVSIEFVSGKDNGSGIAKTTYAINDEPEELTSTLPNNTLTISDNGTYNIKARSYDMANNVSDKTEIDITIKDTSKFFITKWNVKDDNGDTTVVLPINPKVTYDATIHWGDGTSTPVQWQGKTKLDDGDLDILTPMVTYTYELEENENPEKTISIEGTYPDFTMSSTTITPTKLKLTTIEQWGNIGLTSINFKGCGKLTGIIPKSDLAELPGCEYCFNGTGITGLEEGFCFSGGTNWRFLFAGCSKLTSIPDSFKIVDGVTQINNMFQGCTSLETLPENFSIPFGIKYVESMFHSCTSLKELPDGCILPNSLSGGLTYFLAECTNLKTLPDGFTIPKGVTNLKFMFSSSGLESLPDSFSIPESYTGTVNHMFHGCDNLQTIPEDFVIPKGVTNITCLFRSDKKLKGSIIILGNPETYDTCFYNTATESEGTLTVNYSKNCTNIDNIIATGNSAYIIKAEQPID